MQNLHRCCDLCNIFLYCAVLYGYSIIKTCAPLLYIFTHIQTWLLGWEITVASFCFRRRLWHPYQHSNWHCLACPDVHYICHNQYSVREKEGLWLWLPPPIKKPMFLSLITILQSSMILIVLSINFYGVNSYEITTDPGYKKNKVNVIKYCGRMIIIYL